MDLLNVARGVCYMFSRRYFKRNKQLRLSIVSLDMVIAGVVYLILSFLFKENEVVQIIIEILFYIYIGTLTVVFLGTEMVAGTRKINSYINDKNYGFKFYEKEYPTSLIINLIKGKYYSPNSNFLAKVAQHLANFDDDELDQTIWELQYHLNSDKLISYLLNIFGPLATLLGFKEIRQTYIFDNDNNVITWIITTVFLLFLFLYYLQVTHKKRSFLELLESVASNEKEKRKRK